MATSYGFQPLFEEVYRSSICFDRVLSKITSFLSFSKPIKLIARKKKEVSNYRKKTFTKHHSKKKYVIKSYKIKYIINTLIKQIKNFTNKIWTKKSTIR